MKKKRTPAGTGERIRHMKEDTRKPEDRQSDERITSGIEKSVAEGFLFSAALSVFGGAFCFRRRR
jgi:hypothetical protein